MYIPVGSTGEGIVYMASSSSSALIGIDEEAHEFSKLCENESLYELVRGCRVVVVIVKGVAVPASDRESSFVTSLISMLI